MSNPATAPKTVLETILDWSNGRPLWQRDALRRIIAKGKMDATDITEQKRVHRVVGRHDKAHFPSTARTFLRDGCGHL